MSEILSNILEAASVSFRHLRNADTLTLALVLGAVVLLAFLFLRR